MKTSSRRRGRAVQNPVSMFPYLSVLICIIGTLVLAITMLSILGGKKVPLPTREKYVAITDAIKGLKVEHSETTSLIVQARALTERLQELSKELATLKKSKAQAERDDKEAIRILQEVTDTRVRLTKLVAHRAELETSLEKLRRDAKKPATPGTVKVIAGAARVGSSEDGRPKRPVFIECEGTNIVIHPAGTRVPTERIAQSDAIEQLIDRVKRNQAEGAILVLLIRPDGVKTFDRLHRIVQAKNVRYGYTVVPGHGPLDLSDFK